MSRKAECVKKVEEKLLKLVTMLPATTSFVVTLVILAEAVSVGAVVDSRWKGASSYSSVSSKPCSDELKKFED